MKNAFQINKVKSTEKPQTTECNAISHLSFYRSPNGKLIVFKKKNWNKQKIIPIFLCFFVP